MEKTIKSIKYSCISLLICLMPSNPMFSQIIDDKSLYIYVEGEVIDTAKLESIIAERVQILKRENAERAAELEVQNNLLERLIPIGEKNGKVTDDILYGYALVVFDEFDNMSGSIDSKTMRPYSRERIASAEALKSIKPIPQNNSKLMSNSTYALLTVASGKYKKNDAETVRKMLRKRKVSNLFIPYLSALLDEQRKEIIDLTTRLPEPKIDDEDIPYKKGLVKKKNPNNRNYLFVNAKARLDNIDMKMQLTGWEWWDSEQYEEVYTTAPFSFRYKQYNSHPEYRVIKDKVFNNKGTLICQTNLCRSDDDIIDRLKEQMLKEIYIQDYRSNKYDILQAPAKTQEDVKNMLGLPFKSYVDAKTAKKNKKIVDDYFKTQVDEVKASNASWQQRARAKARANDAKNKMGAMLVSAMFDPNFGAAYTFKEQLEKDHKNDLYRIYKISRVNNTSFKVVFMNNKNETSYTGLVTIHQNGPYKWKYSYKLIPNDEEITINPKDYPFDKNMK